MFFWIPRLDIHSLGQAVCDLNLIIYHHSFHILYVPTTHPILRLNTQDFKTECHASFRLPSVVWEMFHYLVRSEQIHITTFKPDKLEGVCPQLTFTQSDRNSFIFVNPPAAPAFSQKYQDLRTRYPTMVQWWDSPSNDDMLRVVVVVVVLVKSMSLNPWTLHTEHPSNVGGRSALVLVSCRYFRLAFWRLGQDTDGRPPSN